jgi:5,10-methylene-tetrahydrofolate dehydrogenase/methenyl tetrahydrofolate cyclohydrolase
MTKYILQNYFISSKYENINNIYILSKEDSITTIIHYLPLIIHIDKKYLIHINKLLEDYLDNKNYTRDLNEQHNIFKHKIRL